MKKTIAAIMIGALCAAAPAIAQTKKKTDAPPAGQITIPKDAKANADGSYSWTDKQGKHWVFRKTPFGVMKSQETVPGPPEAASIPPGLKVVDAGETVRFERTTPFGVTKWEKKKTDLTPEEGSYLELSKPSPSAADQKPSDAQPPARQPE